MKGTKWLLAGSVVFFAFACQSNSGDGKCSPCNSFKKCQPGENNTRPGRCKDRPCGENAASDVIPDQQQEQKEEVASVEVEATQTEETVKGEEAAAPAVETPAVASEEAPAVEAPVATVEVTAPEASAASEISAAAN